MSAELISHVFSAVITLERILGEAEVAVAHREDLKQYAEPIKSQAAVVDQMRRTANKLQLKLASKDRPECYRLISIFYGLNQMVRPEILKTKARMFNPHHRVATEETRSARH